MPRYLLPEISMTDEPVVKKKAAKKKAVKKIFTNNTRNNIFTSKGRVKPGDMIEVDAAEAKDCGLE